MEKLKIKVKLEKHAKMPTRAFKTDAGYDLYSNQPYTEIKPGEGVSFRTGVHLLIPEGYCGLLVSKSGLNVRNGVTSTGLIDAAYTGEIIAKLYNNGDKSYTVFKGDKITQIVILPIPQTELEQVEDFEELTERGDNGFGSSGR
jgi:dUTP pyrophosphatase